MSVMLRHTFLLIFMLFFSCTSNQDHVYHVEGKHIANPDQIWLTHEHLLVDFIGADSINPEQWDRQRIISTMLPYLEELKVHGLDYFVDATPEFLGRDMELLKSLSAKSGIKIMTNTGLYGARNDKYIPAYAYNLDAQELAKTWIAEFENGIHGTSVKPGFIKIGVDNSDPLDSIDNKLVEAAAITHLETGLTIASHTGKARGLWPQLNILKKYEVNPEAFIWVHAQAEENNKTYLKAAEYGCWISLDGMGWEIEKHIEKIQFAKENKILDKILISHDAGWFDPQKNNQEIRPYTNIFEIVIPKLKSFGFSDEEINLLMSVNPKKAFSINAWR